jgi:hypothetical protein
VAFASLVLLSFPRPFQPTVTHTVLWALMRPYPIVVPGGRNGTLKNTELPEKSEVEKSLGPPPPAPSATVLGAVSAILLNTVTSFPSTNPNFSGAPRSKGPPQRF